ncbi:hypothetical protein KSP39_PZI017293 [Platanthera zijinensis]|uniref:BSD domain-containing protein n=1 Tax=Platanthera zijinensis TaxID=2320716 RepID=A0AAP0B4M2_9ASPA
MNFFKSVFSSDPDPSDSSSEGQSPSVSPRKPQENEAGEDERPPATKYDPNPNDKHNLKPNTPWAGLGTLIKTVASKSESVIQTYRRDLEEFGSGLKKETEAIREVASRAVRDLPSSLEAGASAAQESLETVGQAIDDFGGSVWRGTAEIISEGKGALLGADSDSDTFSSDLQIPSGGFTASSSKRYSRFDLQILAMQSDPNTFSEEPEEEEDFRRWMSEFHLKEKEEEIELLCYDNGAVESLFEKLVPSVVDQDTFWTRYFYKLDKLKHAEDLRANLVKRVISREDADEDLTWEVDDEEDEGNQVKETETKANDTIREEDDESNVGNEVESKERGDENKEASNSEHEEDSDSIREGDNEANVGNKVESKTVHAEERKEKGDENKEASNSEHEEDSDDESNVANEVERKIVQAEERKENGDENKEASNSEHVEDSNEKGDTDSIELTQEKEPGEEPEDSKLHATTIVDNEIVPSSAGADDTEPASNLLTTKSGDNVPPKSSSVTVEPFKDGDISVVSSQGSALEDEDLGWDEIEDLGEQDEKKVGGSSSTKRLNVAAEDDDDLTWDIEDDD